MICYNGGLQMFICAVDVDAAAGSIEVYRRPKKNTTKEPLGRT